MEMCCSDLLQENLPDHLMCQGSESGHNVNVAIPLHPKREAPRDGCCQPMPCSASHRAWRVY